MAGFKLERVIAAPVEKVWAAADFTKSVGPFRMEVAKEGDPAQNDVGFVRVVVSGKRKVFERLEKVDPPHCYTYTLIDGVPVKEGYLGKVEFTPKGDATQLNWSVTLASKIPGTGWLIAMITKNTVGKIIDAIEATSCQTA
jgi:uncharacterized protein YndB with AHSA1/START domain